MKLVSSMNDFNLHSDLVLASMSLICYKKRKKLPILSCFWKFSVHLVKVLAKHEQIISWSAICTKWTAKTCSKPIQKSKQDIFAKIGNGFEPFTVFVKNSILDVWMGFQWANALIFIVTAASLMTQDMFGLEVTSAISLTRNSLSCF